MQTAPMPVCCLRGAALRTKSSAPSRGPRGAARRLYCKGRILTSHVPAARRKFLRLLQACARHAALGCDLRVLARAVLRAEG